MALGVVPSTLLMYHVPVVRPACSSAAVTQYCLVAVHTQRMLESSVKVFSRIHHIRLFCLGTNNYCIQLQLSRICIGRLTAPLLQLHVLTDS